MNSLVTLTMVFVAAVFINSALVYAQRRYRLYDKLFGAHGRNAHVVLLVVTWGVAITALFVIEPPLIGLPKWLHFTAIVPAAIGVWLISAAWSRLGAAGVLDGWFFDKAPAKNLKGGIFRLRNPMYIGFMLLFVSVGLWQENASYLWLGLVSYVTLNLFLAKIEDPHTKNHKEILVRPVSK
jgi:protein-S-isoprenylcysteine O-methyltransferase Ste14